MSFIFQVGSLDLSTYLDVQESDGLDPFGDPFTPQFGESPLADYQPLVGLTASNREGIWPLYLKAGSKDLLHDLVAEIRSELDKPRPLRVEWRDANATTSTFFDIEYGKFVPKTRYWLGTHNYVQGMLHLFVRPYGHTATERLVATTVGTDPLLRFPLDAIDGDVGALAKIRLSAPSAMNGVPVVAVSIPPSPSYIMRFPAASIRAFAGATRIGASGLAGSQAMRQTLATTETKIGEILLSAPAAHAGRNRLLALARNASHVATQMLSARSALASSVVTPATAILRANDTIALYDLGVVTVPDDLPADAAATSIYAISLYGSAATSGTPLDINEVYLLPERNTVFTRTNVAAAFQTETKTTPMPLVTVLDGTIGRNYAIRAGATGEAIGNEAGQIGSIPELPVGTAGEIAVLHAGLAMDVGLAYTDGPPYNRDAQNNLLAVEVRVRERFSYAR